MNTTDASAHVCTLNAPPSNWVAGGGAHTMSTYRVKVAGIEYTGQYVSACMAVIAAMVMYSTHSASAKRVPE